MRKGKKSKVMSLLLALTMVISLLPQTVIFAAGEGTVTYDFISETIRDNESDYTEYVTSGNTLNPLLITEYYSGSGYTRNWKYFTKTLTSNPLMTDSNGIYFDGGQYGQWMAFKVKGIPEGIYNVTFGKPASNKKGCIWAMYILDAAVYGSADTATITTAVGDTLGSGVVKAAEFDTYGNANATINLGNIELVSSTSDERIILFKAVKAGVIDEGESAPTNSAGTAVLNSGRFIAMTSLAFEKVEGLKEIKSAPINAVVGEEIEPELTWIGTSGIEIGGEKVIEKIELTKNDDGAVIKTSDGKLYAAATGEATLKVTGKLASGLGGSKSTEIKVTVAENTRTFSGKVIDFDLLPKNIISKEKAKVDFEYITGSTSALDTRSIDDYFVGTDYKRDWKYFTETLNSATTRLTATNGTYFDGGAYGAWVAFKVRGITAGAYNVKMQRPENYKGCVWRVYVLDGATYGNKTNDEITAALDAMSTGVQKLSEIDIYGNTASVVDFGKADFAGNEETEHIILFRAERAGAIEEGDIVPTNSAGAVQKSHVFIAINGISLDGTYIESVDTSFTYDKIGVDETTEIIGTTGKMNTGAVLSDMSNLGYVNYAVVEGNDVVRIEDGKTIRSLKEGTAVIETTVIADGFVLRARDIVEVNDDYGMESVEISGNTTAYIGRSFRVVPVVRLGDGSETIPVGAVISYEIESGSKYVTVDGDSLVAGETVGSAKVRTKVFLRGKTITSDAFTVTVTDELEELAGETFTYVPETLTFEGNEGELLTDVITVPEKGRYQITVNAERTKKSGIVDVWAVPYSDAVAANPEGYLFGAYKLGSADLYNKTEDEYGIMLPDATFDGTGDYLLIMRLSGKNASSTGCNADINSIAFDGESIINEVAVDIYSPRLGPGEETTFEVFAYLSNGTQIPIEDTEIEYSFDEDLITVDGKEMLLSTDADITEKKIAELEVIVTYKGYSKAGTITIIIDKYFGVNTERKPLLYGENVFSVGNVVEFTAAIELNNQQVVRIPSENVKYTIVNNDREAVSYDADNVTIRAMQNGDATIKAEISFRGNIYESEEVDISVIEQTNANPNIDIWFTKGGHAGETIQVLTDATSYTASRKWKFDSVQGSKNTLHLYAANGQFQFDPLAENKYIALRINVPGAGKYNITAQSNNCRYRSGRFDMYIVPADEVTDISSIPETETCVGYMDFWDKATTNPGTVGDVLDVCKAYEFKSGGEYIVLLNLVPGLSAGAAGVIKADKGDAIYPTYISFAEVNAMADAEMTLGKNAINIGEETDVSLALTTVESLPIEINENLLSVIYRSSDSTVATVDKDGKVTGISEGEAQICAVITYGGVTKAVRVPLTVKDASELVGIEMKLGADSVYVYGSTDIALYATMSSENVIRIPEKYITWTLSDDSVAEIENGYITGKAVGETGISAVVSDDFKTGAETAVITPSTLRVEWDATIDPAIYTLKERESAKNNAKKYSWAKSQVKTAVDNADKYLASFDAIYAMLSPEGIPRCRLARHTYDPNVYFCGHCGFNIGENVSIYGWSADPIARPWKIQCPNCKRLFPSNDFGSFYELGLSESKTYWNYLDALQKHHELFVCEDVKAGNECSHTAPAESAPEPGSAQWIKNDPRDDDWYEYYGYGIEGGFLTNDLYGEMDDGWGVDDGFGYKQKFVATPGEIGYHKLYYNNGDGYARYVDGTHDGPVQHTYIAYYLHEAVWFGAGGSKSAYVVRKALNAFRDAFLYTGDAKYGRAGAIMLDRIADIYPAFDWYQWGKFRGDSYRGKITDPVWEHHLSELFATCYDAFLPIYNDRKVIEAISLNPLYKVDKNGYYVLDESGEKILLNAKDNPGAIRKAVEDGILKETYKSVREGKNWGNFGVCHKAVATAAIALNKMPETGEMLDWLMQYEAQPLSSGDYIRDNEGGSVAAKLINDVDYDGNGNENSPHYNGTWITNLSGAAELMAGYKKYPAADLYKNPKFMKMFTAQMKTMLGGYYGAQIGDAGYTATKSQFMGFAAALSAFNITGDREIAQALYLYNKIYNGGDKEKLNGTIFDEDPEEVAERIEAIVEEYGEFDLSGTLMAGYGFAALRAGEKFESAAVSTESNTNRDFAMYFGSGSGHGHLAALNLYISAFGLNMAPDLGYPEQTGNQPNRYQWVKTTISHNTVVVNEKEQNTAAVGKAHHFDSDERVRVMDASADVYSETDDYRRSVIMVDVNDEVAYGVDFFHVKGGNDHLYSFHSQSDEVSAVSGLGEVVVQPTYENENGELIGTYAGPDVMYGNDPGGNAPNNVYPLGYTWLKNVRTYNSPEKDFSVEFKVKDWRKVLEQKADLRLRMTMVSDEPMEEVSFATGLPPQRAENKDIGELEYVLVRNKGNNLDTTFTTVFEPYEAGEKYISSIKKLPMLRDESSRPGLNDSYAAVRIEHTSGRVDYVMYSTNTEALYTVTDGDTQISFRGFAGVMTLENGNVAYRYLNDGDMLELSGNPIADTIPTAYTGTVESFTTDYVFDNFITYTPASGEIVDTDLIKGKYVYIENDGVKNSIYEILDADPDGDNIKLSLGNTTLIRSFVDAYDPDAGYVYNIAKGQSLRIPLSEVVDYSPVVAPIDEVTVSAGSSITIPFNAISPTGKVLTFTNSNLPRGMSVNAETQTITWKPDSSQVGENHVALIASDGTLETAVHFTVTVYGSTTSKPSTENSGTSSEGTGSAGGGGGGGGGGAAPAEPDDTANTDGTGKSDKTENDSATQPGVGNGVHDIPQFTDIGNHTWASDAINSLAMDGIIRGTSERTFSPANNITRADFALLLVRAFKLTSDNAENFADVSASDYFASELAIARNNGIVGGIGDNKYAPRNNITRQDMMVIVYRALQKLNVGFGACDEPQYPDFTTVASYAKEAVSTLIGAGLVNGKSGKIAPADYTTRAEVAVLIKRILDYVK